jgi:hypothetical protein
MSDEERPVCEIHKDQNNDVFVLVDGMKIAKRGLPDTPQAETWIMLELRPTEGTFKEDRMAV